ncbi:thioredoxin-like protein [Thelephora ganbajun]|uniref:Thioredoxin-like protein n=1 Tax=Thelephora ganbajun TaxID=370292 RepID=A0ACB6ZVG7_THEGA|nr:thioredoxin-like protein [Thelephora ganbajun]
MQAQLEKVQTMQQTGYGQYTEITDEKEVIRTSANEPRCVIHFFHRDFKRCEIMDKHLAALAPKYFSTLFIQVLVENVPWLVERLDIRVLPCVMCFVNGVSTDKIIGFEALGNTDAFQTATLELRLKQNGVLTAPSKFDSTSQTYTTATTRTRTHLRGRRGDGDDSDLDL